MSELEPFNLNKIVLRVGQFIALKTNTIFRWDGGSNWVFARHGIKDFTVSELIEVEESKGHPEIKELIRAKNILEAAISAEPKKIEATTCRFCYFKPSGKYYSEGTGLLPKAVYEPYLKSTKESRKLICDANGGSMPGLSTDGSSLITCVYNEFNHPIMLRNDEDAPCRLTLKEMQADLSAAFDFKISNKLATLRAQTNGPLAELGQVIECFGLELKVVEIVTNDSEWTTYAEWTKQ